MLAARIQAKVAFDQQTHTFNKMQNLTIFEGVFMSLYIMHAIYFKEIKWLQLHFSDPLALIYIESANVKFMQCILG